ncbi:MAG: copper resistance protein CopC [Anaerolineae bacterium]
MRRLTIRWKFFRIGPAGTGLTLLLFALMVSAAAAHALLLKSEPADGELLAQSPERVQAWFSEELDSRLSSMQVFNTGGAQVDTGDGGVDLNDPDHASMIVTLPPALPDGAYTVRWAVVTPDDNGLTQGEFAFGVGEGVTLDGAVASPPPSCTPWAAWGTGAAVVVLLAAAIFLFARRKSIPPQNKTEQTD